LALADGNYGGEKAKVLVLVEAINQKELDV
jgi:hypothetical protein